MTQTTKTAHRTVKVRDLDIFYREAGPKDAPTVLLLHGFPTSSQMFRNLIPALGDRYRVVAPDYPGFGHSSMPPREEFAYTFDNLAGVVDDFTAALGLSKYALYVQDYGGPVGYRLACRHPERVLAGAEQPGQTERIAGVSQCRGNSLAVHARSSAARVRIARRLDYGSVLARSRGERRDPTRPFSKLRK
jgi:pimeloyl-ACP methyl ester carboxylesterase